MALPARCVDLTARHVVDALKSVASMRTLLQHLAKIAKPGEGTAKMLVPIARMASSECDWVDNGLHVEITGDRETTIAVAIDLGGNILELIFPRLLVAVPREELTRVVTRSPQIVAPMTLVMKKKSIVLTCDVSIVGTIAPPAFEIAEASIRQTLHESLRKSLPPLSGTSSEGESLGIGEPIARIALKAPRVPALKELGDLDVGWDASAYSSAAFTRDTKPPPAARPPSKAPTRPPPASKPPSRGPKAPSARPPRPAVPKPPRVVAKKKAPSRPPRAGRKSKRPPSS